MRRSWFNHVFEAPLAPGAREAVGRILEEMAGGPVPAARRIEIVESARAAVAGLVGGRPDEVLLTSSGAEASNLAVQGCARAAGRRARLAASAVEHLPVLHPLRSLGRDGHPVVFLPVDQRGRIDPDDLERELRRGVGLVSIQLANEETGTLQPLHEIGERVRRLGGLLHVDAVASGGLVDLDPQVWSASLVSLSGPRLGAPAGTGALWVREGTRLRPLIEGGTQERGLRAGSPGILGLAGLPAACRAVRGRQGQRAAAVRRLRDRLEDGLRESIADVVVLSPSRSVRLPGHLLIACPGAEGEALLFRLRRAGIEATSGSSCADEAGKPSHVQEAMGLDPALGQCSVLFSLGAGSREEDVDRALRAVPEAVAALRAISGGRDGVRG